MGLKFNRQSVQAKALTLINRAISNKALLQSIGDIYVKDIVARARLGKPRNSTGRFPKLKASTIKNRERLARLNKTGVLFQDSKANVTLTGQHLNAFKVTSINTSKPSVELSFEGKREPYITSTSGNIQKNTPSASKLNRFLIELGFITFDQSVFKVASLTKRTNNLIKRELRRILRLF